jgi:18S rRNA (guanine1575-N7)-methyltransferase
VFLCLFVGDGGAAAQQQLPKGLDGENEDPRATFERRQREMRREKSGK